MVSSLIVSRHHLSSPHVRPVFVTAPHTLLPVEMLGARVDSEGPDEGGPTAEQIQNNVNTAQRAWWRVNEDGTEAIGLTESIIYLRNIMKETTFDVRELFIFRCMVLGNEYDIDMLLLLVCRACSASGESCDLSA